MEPTSPHRRGHAAGAIRLFPQPGPRPTGDRSGRLAFHEASRIRAAALHAKRVYPGVVGEVLARELTAHAEFGYRFDADALMTRLAAEILGAPAAPAS
ncbi:MAG TPA: hypothetical protein VD813_03615 [Pseudonocardia sp.]|nr:hypothetical protein [Pseudonocardia sp.]